MKKIKFTIIVKTVLLFGLINAASVKNNNQRKDPNFTLCEPPACTEEQRHILWPTHDKNSYYQCVPDPSCGFKALERPCGPGTVFGFTEQVCIW